MGAEWVEKKADARKKTLRGATGTANLRDKALKEEYDTVCKVLELLQSDKDVRKGTWTNKEIDVINDLMLLTAKPVTYLVNLAEREKIGTQSQIGKIMKIGYQSLNLIHYFTCGP